MQKTLITKIATDVTYANDAQIDAFKAFWRATFAGSEIEPTFEVLVEDEERDAARLLRLVRSEFHVHDQPETQQIEVIAEGDAPEHEH